MTMTQTVKTSDRLPPQNLDIEQAVIGCILLDKGAMEAVDNILKAESFYSSIHSIIFQAAHELYRTFRPTDINGVAAWLSDRNQLVKIGGKAALVKIQDTTPHGIDLEQYAKEVQGYYLRRQLIAAGQKISETGYDGSILVKEALQQSEQEIFAVTQQHNDGKGFKSPADIAIDLFARIEERSQNGLPVGTPTGFYDLDGMTGGLKDGNAIYLIGRPSMGKTSIALNIAKNVAINLKRVTAFFSLEMTQEELILRMVANESEIDSRLLEAGKITQEQWSDLGIALQKVGEADTLRICDTPGLSIEDIASHCRKLHAETDGLGMVFIDHLHLINYCGKDEIAALGHITKTLKELAKELKTPIVTLAQLNRGVENRGDKRPLMSDIRGCGTAEQDADVIIGLYRDEYYNQDTPDRGVAEVIILKQRSGPLGTVKLLFEPKFDRFRNLHSYGGDMPIAPTPPPRAQKHQLAQEHRDRLISEVLGDEL